MNRTDELASKNEFTDDDLEFIFTMTIDEYRRFSRSRSGLKRWFKEMDVITAKGTSKNSERQNTAF